ncbi:MAG: aspartate 1-decarboxylase [Spirochaetaceae bacterium]|nr:aspartate 1-decarboxylase [Spirochaetaceae bacterium]
MEYEGSISIDPQLYKSVGMYRSERVEIFNLNNGERFATYIIDGGPGEICLNGAAARLVHRGDKVIIVAYGEMTPQEAETWEPKVLLLDEQNKIKGTSH